MIIAIKLLKLRRYVESESERLAGTELKTLMSRGNRIKKIWIEANRLNFYFLLYIFYKFF
jgi:hypothetical protein